METLNYHHLQYFWMVAKEGSLTRASEKLRLAPPTLSGQIKELESQLGERLFERSGRGLVLTEAGQLVYRYADEIFTMGRELRDALKGRPTGRPLHLRVGVANGMPKLIAHRLLKPALAMAERVRISCREERPERLLIELTRHELDLVLSDAPVSSGVRAFSHLLGESPVSIFGAADLAGRYREGFPGSLDGAPFLLPADDTALRRSLEEWFDANGIRPELVGEFDDSALLKAFGGAGAGLFPGVSAIEEEICYQYRVECVGRIPAIRERFYAISMQRRLKHPAVVTISAAAREILQQKATAAS